MDIREIPLQAVKATEMFVIITQREVEKDWMSVKEPGEARGLGSLKIWSQGIEQMQKQANITESALGFRVQDR